MGNCTSEEERSQFMEDMKNGGMRRVKQGFRANLADIQENSDEYHTYPSAYKGGVITRSPREQKREDPSISQESRLKKDSWDNVRKDYDTPADTFRYGNSGIVTGNKDSDQQVSSLNFRSENLNSIQYPTRRNGYPDSSFFQQQVQQSPIPIREEFESKEYYGEEVETRGHLQTGVQIESREDNENHDNQWSSDFGPQKISGGSLTHNHNHNKKKLPQFTTISEDYRMKDQRESWSRLPFQNIDPNKIDPSKTMSLVGVDRRLEFKSMSRKASCSEKKMASKRAPRDAWEESIHLDQHMERSSLNPILQTPKHPNPKQSLPVSQITLTNPTTEKKQTNSKRKSPPKNGYGVEIWDDGTRFQGYWEDGKKNGKGLFCWKDGSSYCGGMKNNYLHGFGKGF
jgi:hypothetical protein